MSPNYISNYFTIHVPARTLRPSSDSNCLTIPRLGNSITGDKRFHIAAAKAWNSIPVDIKSATTTSQFKSMLKTHLLSLFSCLSTYFCVLLYFIVIARVTMYFTVVSLGFCGELLIFTFSWRLRSKVETNVSKFLKSVMAAILEFQNGRHFSL